MDTTAADTSQRSENGQPASGARHIRADRARAPQPGDILLFGPDGKLVATAIQLATRSHYHHSALYDGDGMVIEAMPKGVHRAPLGDRDADAIRLDVDETVRRGALDWARARVGDKYDDRSIVLILLDRIVPWLRLQKPRATRFSCASFLAEAYHQVGVDLVPGRRWEDLVPGDFAALLEGSAVASHHASHHGSPAAGDSAQEPHGGHESGEHARHLSYIR